MSFIGNKSRNVMSVLLLCTCLSGSAADTWRDARKALRDKPRTIIVNNDGCDVTNFPAGETVTLEAIRSKMLDRTTGSQIDVITYCPYAVGFELSTDSKVTEVFTDQPETQTVNVTAQLLAQQTDALKMAVEFCRAGGFEVFASMRANDTHEVWHPKRMSDFKKAHPELLLGSAEKPTAVPFWTAFNFRLPQVRELFLAICTELMNNYDVDGLEIDFLRFPLFFPSAAAGGVATAEERTMMTDLMKQVRESAETIGKKRGRPLLVAVRVPDSIELAHAIGLDVESWLHDGSVDLLYTGADWWRYAPLREMIELGHRYGARVYPSVDVAWSQGRGIFERNLPAQFAAQTAAAFAAGADGVYHFNMFYAPEYFAALRRDPAALKGVNKKYFARYAVNQDFILKDHDRFNRIPNLVPEAPPLAVTDEKPLEIPLEFGEDFNDPETLSFRPQAKLYLHLKNGTHAPRVTVNGSPLETGQLADETVTYEVPLALLHPGECRIRLESAPGGSAQIDDLLLEVNYFGKAR